VESTIRALTVVLCIAAVCFGILAAFGGGAVTRLSRAPERDHSTPPRSRPAAAEGDDPDESTTVIYGRPIRGVDFDAP
jgi:hypothetical protein